MTFTSAPQTLVDVIDWKLIGWCNLRCAHCYGPPKTAPPLEERDLQKVIDTFGMLQPSWVVLTGGEPLLVPSIDTVLESITGIGAQIALSTNGTYFEDHQEVIEQHVSSLNLALDGSTPRIHAVSRGDETTYHTVFTILRHYQAHPERKPPLVRVGTVYSRATQGDLITIAQQLEPFAGIIDTWKIYELMDYDIQQDLRRPLLHEPGTFEQETTQLMQATPLAPKIQLAPTTLRDKAYFMVNPQGIVVLPTEIEGVSHEVPLGNILTDSLDVIVERWSRRVEKGNYEGNHASYAKEVSV